MQAPKKSVLSRNPKNHVALLSFRASSRRDDRRGRSDYPNAYALGPMRAPLVPTIVPIYPHPAPPRLSFS